MVDIQMRLFGEKTPLEVICEEIAEKYLYAKKHGWEKWSFQDYVRQLFSGYQGSTVRKDGWRFFSYSPKGAEMIRDDTAGSTVLIPKKDVLKALGLYK